MPRPVRLVAALLLVLAAAGCSTAYYAAMEQLGWAKRDILVGRVQEARDSQSEAKTQFTDALQQFRSVVQVDGGDLETKYAALSAAYDDSAARADDVRERIAAVRSVGSALFKEWQGEIGEMKDARLRARSQELFRDSQQRYDRMLAAMQRAEASMTPVLDAMKDQVLFLKHNLNAKAVSAMQGTLREIESDVGTLVTELERSIAEANQFITQLEQAA